MIINQPIKNTIYNAQFNTTESLKINTIYDIIVPVYNGFEELKKNLESLIKHTQECHSIYYLNDASKDTRIKSWLDKVEKQYKQIHVVHNNKNLGYLHNVNNALRQTQRDVILLNSDTQVTENWLEELSIVASHSKTAIVCPLSDNATILTLKKELLPYIDKLKEFTGQWYSIPTAVGSCMLIKRSIIETHGVFDEYYNPGYGEECDYSLNLRLLGYDIACAPASFVFHSGSASFSEQSDPLKLKHQKLLDLRWPHYNEEIQKFAENNPIRFIEEHLYCHEKKNHVLHIVHGIKNKGGVELFTKELIESLPKTLYHTILIPGTSKLIGKSAQIENLGDNIRCVYYQYKNQNVLTKIGNQNADLSQQELDVMFVRMLLAGNYKLVHFHSFVGIGSLVWPLICKSLSIPYLLTNHDHYSICFNYSLLKNHYSEHCKKTLCHSDDKECLKCLKSYTNFSSISTSEYIDDRNNIWREIVEGAEHIIVPSQYLQNLFELNYPHLKPDKLHILEPYNYPTVKNKQIIKNNSKIHIGFLGVFTHEKGAQVFLDAYHLLKHKSIQWKIIGDINPRYTYQLSKTNIATTGLYDRHDLPELLEGIDLIIIPSIRPETYCITLTEAWLNNIPVIAADCGALSSRIKDNINGKLFVSESAKDLTNKIEHLIDNDELLLNMKQYLQQQNPVPNNSASFVYKLYEKYINQNHCISIQKNNTINQLPLPKDNAYTQMNNWLSAEMTLEAASDWKEPKDIDIVIVGNNTHLYQSTLNSCKTYAPKSRTFLADSIIDSHLDQLSEIICILEQGSLLNDNFGNWIHAFESSQKAVSLADYALINNKGQMYAPQFQARFDVFQFLRKKSRIGTVLIHKEKNISYLKRVITSISFESMQDSLIEQDMQNGIHYFPHFSHLLPDYKWVEKWKNELSVGNNLEISVSDTKISEVSIVLLSNLNQKFIKPFIETLLKQVGINIHHIYLFSSHYITLNENKLSAHYIDFNQSEKYINSVIQRDKSDALLFINDNLIFSETDIIKNLLEYLNSNNIQAVSPIFNLSTSNDTIYSNKVGLGLISGRGSIADVRFEAKQLPVLTQLLDEDCFLITKKAWDKINGFDSIGNVYFRANVVSGKLSALNANIALIPLNGLTKKNLPSHIIINSKTSLEKQRDEVLNLHKSFYKNAKYLSKSLNSQDSIELDLYFGTFKTPKNLPRVVAYAHDTWASSFYRVKAPLGALVAADRISSNFLPNKNSNRTATAFEINKQDPDTLLLHNYLSLSQLAALKQYKQLLDIPIVLSFDDLLTEIPNYNHYSKTNPIDIDKRIKKAAQYADRIVVTTDYLAQKFSRFHDDVVVIENTLPKELWGKPKAQFTHKPHSKPRIGWAGAAQHLNDLEWLEPIIKSTQKDVQWVFYGFMPDSFNHDLIEFHPHTAFNEYHKNLEQLNLDIAIAPLVHNSFNYAKSNLKLLEYGALSLPTLCSDTLNYSDSPALKLSNDPKLWIKTINQLISSQGSRVELGTKMYEWVCDNYYLEDNLEMWLNALFLKT